VDSLGRHERSGFHWTIQATCSDGDMAAGWPQATIREMAQALLSMRHQRQSGMSCDISCCGDFSRVLLAAFCVFGYYWVRHRK
jgi:hypothetical protein